MVLTKLRFLGRLATSDVKLRRRDYLSSQIQLVRCRYEWQPHLLEPHWWQMLYGGVSENSRSREDTPCPSSTALYSGSASIFEFLLNLELCKVTRRTLRAMVCTFVDRNYLSPKSWIRRCHVSQPGLFRASVLFTLHQCTNPRAAEFTPNAKTDIDQDQRRT